jgi:hypothetical protein
LGKQAPFGKPMAANPQLDLVEKIKRRSMNEAMKKP